MASLPPFDRPDLTTAVRQATEAYRAGRFDEAAQSCAAAIAWDSGHFDAHHLAGLVKLAQGDVAQAIRYLAEAVKLRARSPEAANDLGRAFHRAGDDVAAVVQHERALALNPVYPPGLVGLAAAQHALGWREDALESYRRALTYRPGFAEALDGAAMVLLDLGRAEEALQSCNEALAADPRLVEAHLNRGNIFRALGRHQRALASYDEALRLRPGSAQALANKSAIFSLLNRHEEGLCAADAALALAPGHVDALVNRGIAAQQLGRLEDAVAAFDQALTAAPEHVAALRHRGAAERDLGRLDAALASFAEVVALAPHDVEALTEQGNLLRRLERHDEALASFEKALTVSPANGYVLAGAAREALSLCDWNKAERWGHDIAARIEQGKPVWPGVVPALSDSPRLQALAARNFVRDKVRISVRPPSSALRNRDRIRLAYVAANDFGAAAAGAMAALAARHDRTAFDVIGLSFGGAADGGRRGSPVGFDQFHDVTTRTDAAAARLLRELEVDIAVDLEGYAEDARPGIFAARPAPVQVSFGYPATLGAEFIDYIMADKIVLPFDEQKAVTERIVQLRDCYRAIDDRHEPSEPPSREAAGLPDGGVVFCCFAETHQIARPVFDAWMRLLSACEGSVLWLAKGGTAAGARLRAAATDRGVDPARLVFAPPAPRAEHLSRHRLADIFLDTYPSGAASAADALWMGVPVVTRKGHAFSARTGASFVTAVGQSELIAADLAGYEALALRLATEPDRLADCKRRLAEQRATAPLFDLDGFRRQVESAYFKMHGLARSGAPPQSFAVTAA